MKMNAESKIFLQPGDTVTLKQDVPNKPVMTVVRKELNIFRDQPQGISLKGMRCRWFTTDGLLQEAVFSTKDLVLVKSVTDEN